ncbi:MAG: exosortase/archaeosortase family protein [Planctomycetes bacterium]|nr:exosortase/archaeosortase family protein [Planctomycetota bacterium]
MTAQPIPAPRIRAFSLTIVVLLIPACLWAYWTTLERIVARWTEDPQYSHGYLVPAFALYLLWLRRERLDAAALNANWLGTALLLIAAGLRLAGAHYSFEYLDQASFLPCCAGLFLLAGGWQAFSWSLPSVAFLAFMIPLPHSVSLALSAPMQGFATAVSTFALQVLGRPAVAEGNVILLNDIELGIVEACSGLRMLVVFFALSTAVAILIRKPWWEKLLIAGSAVPIALASNVLRITVTGLFYDSFGNHFGGALFHDVAGWLMMPLGLLFLGIELWILKTLLIEPPSQTAQATRVTMQRFEVNPLALYASEKPPNREKPIAAPEEEVVETAT